MCLGVSVLNEKTSESDEIKAYKNVGIITLNYPDTLIIINEYYSSSFAISLACSSISLLCSSVGTNS